MGEFGFGEGDETTIINAGFITTYFRKTFNITSLDDFYRLRIRRDDGIVIYINGVEVFRDNFNIYETIAKTTLASNAEDDGNVWNEILLKNTGFVVGQNTIAVEIHQVSAGSSDLSFFFEMIGMKTAATFVTRGPYLQRAAPTSIKVMWNTSVASIGQVKYGTDPNNLSSTSSPTPLAIDHNVTLTGLTPNTKYYYSVETNTTVLERTSDNHFITPPTTGTEKKTRIWAMGCFGSGKLPQRQVQERFLEQVHNNYVDMFLQLGDIAYADGSESDFQKNYFQVYQNYRTMKQTPIYNALGNHEYCNGTCYSNFAGIASANIFENFTAAEAGGVASGTERYYSFNHGNIHVISIDAFGTEPTTNFHVYDSGSLQKQWLINDLAANTQKWAIVIVHAPPYSKGKHDSDNPPAPGHNTESEMIGVRSLVPLFDQYNVDLVLGSHSHNYERSKLIKNHTGNSDSYVPATHEVIGTNGKYDGTALNTCLYNKQTANKGTVYAVVGSGGRLETGVSSPWPHPAMAAAYDVTVQGSYLIEIEGSRMDVSWVTIDDVLINGDPIVKDRFTMMKDINLTAETVPVAIGIPTITLTAPWSGTFMWSNGATTQSIIVAVTNTSYTVTDYSIACLSKTFIVTTCPTINTLTNPITSGVLKYEVSQTLTATNVISSGANISYDAGKAIFLNPGFFANSGSVFKAYIDGCGNF